MREKELRTLQSELDSLGKSYVLGTVISVKGSASAKPGSKILISENGENLWGWIGGGCAESFTKENALEALKDRHTRIIRADLDDEIFGLGMPCGGIMEIFLEPHFPRELLSFPFSREPRLLSICEHLGFDCNFTGPTKTFTTMELISALAQTLVKTRNIEPKDLTTKKIPFPPTEFLVLGTGRITEELAYLATILQWKTRIYGIAPNRANYPSSAKVETAQPNYEGLNIVPGSIVIVASHHKGDPEYISAALRAEAPYIGLVASTKRAGIVFDYLKSKGIIQGQIATVHSPTGLNLNCQNPGEIALSIIAEIISIHLK